jgi:hypothetical protein
MAQDTSGHSPNWAEIVGGIACDAFEVVTQSQVCPGVREETQQLFARNPPAATLADRDDLGHRFSAHRDDHFLSVLDAAEDASGVIAEFAGRDVGRSDKCGRSVLRGA